MPPARRSARTASSSAAREAAQPYTRANRQRSPGSSRPSASIARPANGKTSLRLTVKAPPSKLRQATSGSQIAAPVPPNPYADNASESDATPQPAARTARATRNPRTVVEPESEEEDEEEEEQDEDGEDVDQEMADADSEEDAEAEDEDEEEEEEEEDDMEDELQADHPPPPIIKQERPMGRIKPNVTVTAPPEGPMKSVEDKEMDLDDDDEEEEDLSELDSNENDEEEEDDEGEDDSEDDDKTDISRSATPDLSKLTRRQRGAFEEAESTGLLALSNEAQKKKHLTAEEHAMRRAEMARRRKNLSEKRNEEEKMDTINKLLKKPAPKRRTRAEILAAQHADSMATPGLEDGEEERPDPLFVRWVNAREGSRLGVPEEWLEGSVGAWLGRGAGSGRGIGIGGGRMVEEVA